MSAALQCSTSATEGGWAPDGMNSTDKRWGLASEAFRPPRRMPDIIERRSLIERLRSAVEGQIVRVLAPAGYGKTELLAAFYQTLRMDGVPVGWLDMARLGRKPLAPALAAAFGFADLAADAEISLDTVIEAIAAIPAQRSVVLLDGVAPVHGPLLGPLLEILPDRISLVMASRHDPGIPISRFRIRGLLSDFGPADLAFTTAETRRLAPHWSPGDLDRLCKATLGWPALVRLAVLSLSGRRDEREMERVCSGAHPDIRSFVREEVLAGTGPRDATILSVAACLGEAPRLLICELAGAADGRSPEKLDDLVPALLPLDERADWFACHPMMRAVLRIDLAAEETRQLHSQAAAWFAGQGLIEKAVLHAGHAGDFGFAAHTIQAAGGVDLFLRAGYKVLRRLLDGLPTEVIEASPGLRLCAALVLAKEGRILAAREAMDELKALARDDRQAELPEHVVVHIDSLLDIYEDRRFEPEQIEWLENRLRSQRLRDTWELGWLHNHLCIAHTRQGALRRARLHALKALECYRSEGTPYAQAFMLVHLALVNLMGGRLAAAAHFSRQAEDLARRTQGNDETLLAIARIPLAEALYRQGHVRAADNILEECLPLVAAGEGWVDLYARGFVSWARCRFRLKGLDEAMRITDRAARIAEDRRLPRLDLVVTTLRVELLTLAGALGAAEQAARALPGEGGWPTRREMRDAQVALARLRLRQGESDEARRLLLDLVSHTQDDDDALTGLSARIVLAEACHAGHDPAAGMETLIEAASLALEHDLVEPFVAEGESFRDLVRALMRRSGLATFPSDIAAFLNRVLALGGGGLERPGLGLLSERELGVLALMAAGHRNKQIARDLGITEATVKFHIKNLFAKLGVSRRAVAVSLASAMGLLEQSPTPGGGHKRGER